MASRWAFICIWKIYNPLVGSMAVKNEWADSWSEKLRLGAIFHGRRVQAARRKKSDNKIFTAHHRRTIKAIVSTLISNNSSSICYISLRSVPLCLSDSVAFEMKFSCSLFTVAVFSFSSGARLPVNRRNGFCRRDRSLGESGGRAWCGECGTVWWVTRATGLRWVIRRVERNVSDKKAAHSLPKYSISINLAGITYGIDADTGRRSAVDDLAARQPFHFFIARSDLYADVPLTVTVNWFANDVLTCCRSPLFSLCRSPSRPLALSLRHRSHWMPESP